MFKKTPENPQFDLFSMPSTQPGKREAKKYDDPHGWHNPFYANVTSKIDETVFSPLFKEGNMGAPNASIRVIIAMSVIREGFGCSDEELFEKCRFDLPVRKALGLFSLSDVVPSVDTCYLPGRRICGLNIRPDNVGIYCSTGRKGRLNVRKIRTGKNPVTVEKNHSVKNDPLCTPDRRILWLSKTCEGHVHDKKIMDEQPLVLPKGITLWQDTGFVGHMPENVTVKMPAKKPKGKELTRAKNRKTEKYRVSVSRWNTPSAESKNVVLSKNVSGVASLVLTI